MVSSRGKGAADNVTVSLYDLQGRHIYTLLESADVTMDLRLPLPADCIPSGQYIIQVEGNGKSGGMPVVIPSVEEMETLNVSEETAECVRLGMGG